MRIVSAVAVGFLLSINGPALRAWAESGAAQLASLKSDYKRPPAKPIDNPALVDLGRHLFFEPRISASGKTACVTCHQPYLGWSVTDLRSRNDSGRLTSRRSQTLVGLGHANDIPYGWDGRNVSLEAQAKASIATGSMSMRETDTPVKVEVIEQRIQAIPAYAEKFDAAGLAVNLDNIAKALAAFERTMEPGPSPFDAWVEGDEGAISEAAKRGFVLFTGKANCSGCHTGWRFTDDNFHDIGTSTSDRGRGNAVKDDPMLQFAFKTPTLRSVALRPPYMHNGSAVSLYEVVKHYEKGGIARPGRSPMMMALDLSEQDRFDLVAFMQTLTGMPEGEPPPALPKPF
jgi:cytochrome c peroxidase